MSTNQLFETSLTDGARFRKYKPILYVVGIILYGVAIIYSTLMNGGPNENIGSHYMPYIIVTIIILVLWYGLYFFLNRKIERGSLKIFEDKVEIYEEEIHTYKLNEIENLEIQRGSTYHYTHQTGNEIVIVGNYIRFKSNNKSKEYEFLIDSKKKNEAFEAMINTLQKNQVRLYYTSI